MNRPYRVFECPMCGRDINIEGEDKETFCQNCECRFLVCNDAEFVNGMWRDLTTLKFLEQ
jgi:DNA-directed RNA polymerase subunit RPC12/RpoP